MTDRERAIIMAYTGACMLEGEKLDAFYQYLAEIYGRPVYTHEWLILDIKEKSRPDFIRLCEEEHPERKKGKWRHYEGMLKCLSCNVEIYDDIMEFLGDDVPKYCPNCGSYNGGEQNGTRK